ncbi:MAG TPA: hypothetical protein VGE31_00440, partial [Candidatus Paceibacterota bacterium]
MKHLRSLLALVILFPVVAFAQQPLQQVFVNILSFVNRIVIPFILGIAFLFFAWNAIRYFVIEGGSEDGRDNAKNLALYSVLAFVVIVSFWGLVNFI